MERFQTRGSSIAAKDGEIDTVTDLLFDDENWSIRWMVVDPGTWFSKRNVLLPSSHLMRVLPAARGIRVDLTRDQVKSSPDVDAHQPVSRQMEASTYEHYGWAPYWPVGVGPAAVMAGYPGYTPPAGYAATGLSPAPAVTRTAEPHPAPRSGDPHLRSTTR